MSTPLDQAGPVLAPAVGQPVGGDLARGHLGLVPLRQRVLGPGVELGVKRLHLVDEPVAQGDHLGDGHAVVGDLKSEEVVEPHGPGDLVPQVAEPQDPVAKRAADRLGDLPRGEPFVQVLRTDQHPVDVVGRRVLIGLPLALERVDEPVLRGGLPGLGLGAGLDDLGHRAGRLGGAEADLLELADRQVVEAARVLRAAA